MANNLNTRKIKIGNIFIGGGSDIAVQSMLSTPSGDVAGNVLQAIALEGAGCDILRVAIPNEEALALITAIKKEINIPLVADIHFDYRLAIGAAERGIDKIRINPGNIGDEGRVKQVVDICKAKDIPIRIGVNSGSVERAILAKHGAPSAEAMVESALFHAKLLEKFGFYNTVISIKSSNVKRMIEAYKLMAESGDYPLHLGVTESGTERMGLIKSSIGIGSLLALDIGDTLRVTLTEDPVKEIAAGRDILKALGKYDYVEIISCPTCGRTKIDLISLTKQVEAAVKAKNITKKMTVAVMGCAVNGPGEAREADLGIAAGDGEGLLFKKGEIVGKYPEESILAVLMEEIEKF